MTETIEVPRTRLEELEETVQQQQEAIEELEQKTETQPSDLIEIRSDGTDVGLMDIWIAGIPLGKLLQRVREEVDDIRGELEEAHPEPENPGLEAEEPDSTPLERICALPEHVADRELTANQRRARAVAKDIEDYGETLRDGQRINTTRMRTVLTALSEDGETMYRTTVHRVMEFLEEFGEDEIEVRKQRNGQKMVYFPDEFVERLDRTDVGYGVNGETPLLVG